MNKMKIRVHEASNATLQDLLYDDTHCTLLAKFGTLGEAERCNSMLLDALFDEGGELSKHMREVVQCFPIRSNVAVFMDNKAGADAVNDYILKNFGE